MLRDAIGRHLTSENVFEGDSLPGFSETIEHPEGLLLVDTGMIDTTPELDADADEWGKWVPHRLPDELVRRVVAVVNTHLHVDHCGGNPALPGRPIFTQRAELEAALRTPDYTLPDLVAAPGLRYEQLDGETEILPGVLVVPTPGHTAGHQSVVVRRGDGTIVVAGQSHDTATAYGGDVLAWRARRDQHPPPLPAVPAWIDRLQRFDPARVVFAHDNAVWEPA